VTIRHSHPPIISKVALEAELMTDSMFTRVRLMLILSGGFQPIKKPP
jgi:hypothetical protein